MNIRGERRSSLTEAKEKIDRLGKRISGDWEGGEWYKGGLGRGGCPGLLAYRNMPGGLKHPVIGRKAALLLFEPLLSPQGWLGRGSQGHLLLPSFPELARPTGKAGSYSCYVVGAPLVSYCCCNK